MPWNGLPFANWNLLTRQATPWAGVHSIRWLRTWRPELARAFCRCTPLTLISNNEMKNKRHKYLLSYSLACFAITARLYIFRITFKWHDVAAGKAINALPIYWTVPVEKVLAIIRFDIVCQWQLALVGSMDPQIASRLHATERDCLVLGTTLRHCLLRDSTNTVLKWLRISPIVQPWAR